MARAEEVNGYTIEADGDRFAVCDPAGERVGEAHDLAAAWARDAEPWGAGRDPFGRPDPQTHPEFWCE